MSERSLRRRVVLSTVALTAVVMILSALLVQVVLGVVVRQTVNRELSRRADVVVTALRTGSPADLSVGARLGEGALVFDRTGTLRAGRIPADIRDQVRALSRARTERFLDVGEELRLRAAPVGTPQDGVVVVGEPLAPYERSETYALVVTVALGVLVTAGAGVLAAVAVQRSLHPVLLMSQRADDWSEHDLGRRFDLGPGTNELTALGATLDRLLERVADALRTERRLTGEIAHELRTPLTAIIGSAELSLLDDQQLTSEQRESLEDIATAAHRLEQTVTTLVEVARTPEGLRGESATVGAVLDHVSHRVSVVPSRIPPDTVVAAPLRVVTGALGPVLDNAARHAEDATLSVERSGHAVRFVVQDDGPGLVPGRDPFSPVENRSSAGLGLALARRIARSVGGDVTSEPSARGARFVVTLPCTAPGVAPSASDPRPPVRLESGAAPDG